MSTEKFDTLLPRKSTDRLLRSKLLISLGATGVLLPFPQNTERLIERKILLQNTFNPNPVTPPPPPVTNGLLNGLTAYWNMDQAQNSTRTDSTANALHLSDNNSNLMQDSTAIIGHAALCSQSMVSNGLTHAANALFNTGAGISISFSCWLRGNGLINNNGILSYDDGTHQAYDLFFAAGPAAVQWLAIESGTLAQKTINMVTGAALGTLAYHHFAFGYDDANKIIWAQFDNGTRSTVGCNGMNTVSAPAFVIGNFSTFAAPQQVGVDETGYWRRVLTTTDVSNLFNGGAGLPFSSFQN